MFEYVISAIDYTRIGNKALLDMYNNNNDDECIKNINKLLKSINRPNHKLSILFNAYTEEKVGHALSKILYKDTINKIYSDSGGLQMVTLGHTPTEELKNKVYNIQSNYSNVGMCFDEIPVVIKGEKSVRGDTKNRFFDMSILDAKAKETGVNLRKQIEHFKNNPNNKCNAMMIIQGNCFESYQRWTDIVLNEIGHHNWKYLESIAIGGAALGTGMLEDFKKTFFCTNLNLPSDINITQYHLLGVGSLVRMLPIIALQKSGIIDDKKIISYDSSTHTSFTVNGLYFKNHGRFPFPTIKNKNYYQVLDDINKNMNILGNDIIKDEYLYHRLSMPTLWNEKYKNDVYNNYHTIFAYLVSTIYNFTTSLDKLLYDNNFFDEFSIKTKLFNPVNAYMTCRDVNDVNEWIKCFQSIIDTNSIEHVTNAVTLDNFF